MYQHIILIGRLGTDPELRYMDSGQAVCTFSLATSDKWTGKDGAKKEQTTWWRVTAWGKTGENVNSFLKKGAQVMVTGKLRPDENGSPRVFQKSDGNWASSYELTASEVKFLDSKKTSEGATEDEIAF